MYLYSIEMYLYSSEMYLYSIRAYLYSIRMYSDSASDAWHGERERDTSHVEREKGRERERYRITCMPHREIPHDMYTREICHEMYAIFSTSQSIKLQVDVHRDICDT